MNKKIADRTYLALKYLYLNTIDVQNQPTVKNLMMTQPLAYAKEFCTIRLTTARSSGHSSAIARFINEYYDHDWALISVNKDMSDQNLQKISKWANPHIKKITQSYVCYDNKGKIGKTILTSFASFDRELRGLELDGIIIDCACMLTQTKTENLYAVGLPCMVRKPHQFFIFVE